MLAAAVATFIFALPSFQSPTPERGVEKTGNALKRSGAFGPLQFRTDGTFQISIFEDLHFGESRSLAGQPHLITKPLSEKLRDSKSFPGGVDSKA